MLPHLYILLKQTTGVFRGHLSLTYTPFVPEALVRRFEATDAAESRRYPDASSQVSAYTQNGSVASKQGRFSTRRTPGSPFGVMRITCESEERIGAGKPENIKIRGWFLGPRGGCTTLTATMYYCNVYAALL